MFDELVAWEADRGIPKHSGYRIDQRSIIVRGGGVAVRVVVAFRTRRCVGVVFRGGVLWFCVSETAGHQLSPAISRLSSSLEQAPLTHHAKRKKGIILQ